MYAMFKMYTQSSLILRITIALILGIGVGLLADQQVVDWFAPFGELLLRLLKFLIVPIVLFTLIVGVNQGSTGGVGRLGGKTIAWYLLTTAIAMIVGMAVASVLSPGAGMQLASDAVVEVKSQASIVNVVLSIVPDNLFTAFAQMNMLGIIFTAVTFGLALLKLRESPVHGNAAKQVLTVVEGLNQATMMIMRGVLHYLPIGIFAIVAGTVAKQGAATITSLAGMVVVFYVALFVHAGLYCLAMLVSGVKVGNFIRYARTPIVTAFATQSSSGTLPITMDAASKMGLSHRAYSFILPLGATINMDGAAIRIAISAVFAANVIGVPLDLMQMAQIVIVGTLATIGTAGVPGAGIIMIATVFAQVGLPIETVALLVAIDSLVGMGATALNVTGDLVGAAIIGGSEKDDAIDYESPPTF
ncbi:dicarboxylate/amino acid:cation symporter [Pseudomonas sp. TMP25]|uniref:dicarboxylate/amino acid:cation symporter n=1 Tax=Pseudomonas sp. TMP25 TaxID=3136561 RepID=UPI0031014FCE